MVEELEEVKYMYIMSDEEIEESRMVAAAMMKHGGSFVRALGNALAYADDVNTQVIKEHWPNYWEQYLRIAKREKVD